ncbi:MAG: hypothetical protein WC742_10335 [Gallionellaceae bacterium]|jgi:hypothetical protein
MSHKTLIRSGNIGGDRKVATVKLRFDEGTGALVEQPKAEFFLRGPIPLSWLSRAARLPGKTINVSLAICWLVGMSSTKLIRLNRNALERFHVSNDAAGDALRRMETDGLITLHKKSGRRPLIEILSVSTEK